MLLTVNSANIPARMTQERIYSLKIKHSDTFSTHLDPGFRTT